MSTAPFAAAPVHRWTRATARVPEHCTAVPTGLCTACISESAAARTKCWCCGCVPVRNNVVNTSSAAIVLEKHATLQTQVT